ncbi:MAG: DUF4160 domain-containing protein [Magnetococcales bacterium]|nr:DUF4160 domain-containing protein [Magnetococcales bacterium]
MGEIERINGITISIFPNDHIPAHVHIISPDGAVRIKLNIKTLEVIKAVGPARKVKKAIKWVEENREKALAAWEEIHKKG